MRARLPISFFIKNIGDVVVLGDFMMVVKKTILDFHFLVKSMIGAVNGVAYVAGFSPSCPG